MDNSRTWPAATMRAITLACTTTSAFDLCGAAWLGLTEQTNLPMTVLDIAGPAAALALTALLQRPMQPAGHRRSSDAAIIVLQAAVTMLMMLVASIIVLRITSRG